ncbi:MAG: hypothetical protein J6038_01875 [Bacilli bacterium]|nr:hypothetical protein [Bacilli bacterium]
MAYVKANLDQLQGYEAELRAYLSDSQANYEAFYRAVSSLEWDDAILERVVELTNSALTHVNTIRGAIEGARKALLDMEDALERYCSIRHGR